MKNLNKLYWIKKEIKQIEEQIKELTILSAVSFNGMPSGNSVSSPVERFNERLEELTQKLAIKRTESLEEKERIERYIETIEDVEIRVIARARFIECKSWQKIGEENFMDRTTVYRKLDKYIREKEGTKDESQAC
jgi:predicted DNA-binding protein